MALQGTEAQMVIAGPVRLLHMDADRSDVMVYRVSRQLGTVADCQAIKRETVGAWDRVSDLSIGKDEMVCVAGTGRTQLSWHARSAADSLASQQVSLR